MVERPTPPSWSSLSAASAAALSNDLHGSQSLRPLLLQVISIELTDARTNKTLCLLSRENGGLVYGSISEVGDERGYLVGIEPCRWGMDAAPRLRVGQPMRATAVYDATSTQTGVMAKLGVFWTLHETAVNVSART